MKRKRKKTGKAADSKWTVSFAQSIIKILCKNDVMVYNRIILMIKGVPDHAENVNSR